MENEVCDCMKDLKARVERLVALYEEALEKVKAKQAEEEAARKASAQELAKKIEEIEVCIETKAGEGGRLFGSITSKDVCEALKTQHNIAIDKKKLQMSQPIKALGTFSVKIKLYQDVSAELAVKVTE